MRSSSRFCSARPRFFSTASSFRRRSAWAFARASAADGFFAFGGALGRAGFLGGGGGGGRFASAGFDLAFGGGVGAAYGRFLSGLFATATGFFGAGRFLSGLFAGCAGRACVLALSRLFAIAVGRRVEGLFAGLAGGFAFAATERTARTTRERATNRPSFRARPRASMTMPTAASPRRKPRESDEILGFFRFTRPSQQGSCAVGEAMLYLSCNGDLRIVSPVPSSQTRQTWKRPAELNLPRGVSLYGCDTPESTDTPRGFPSRRMDLRLYADARAIATRIIRQVEECLGRHTSRTLTSPKTIPRAN